MAGGNSRERTALIFTVLDEARTIDALMESISGQTRPPDEVVVVDGGSSDGTWQRLQSWRRWLPLRLIRAPGAGISTGRNLAIEATAAQIVAVTDAGVRLAPDWLEQLAAGLAADVDVVSGFFRSDPCTVVERAMGATVLPDLDDISPGSFLPSSRSLLFRRTAWKAVSGYPEWLDYGEDLVFDLALKKAGHRFVFAPRATVWFRPRGSLSGLFTQYYRYARGDGKADLWRRRHAIRYATYVLAAALAVRRGAALLPLGLGVFLYTRRPYARLRLLLGGSSPRDVAYALALVPVIRLVGDVAKMLGYPVGVWWRLHRRAG